MRRAPRQSLPRRATAVLVAALSLIIAGTPAAAAQTTEAFTTVIGTLPARGQIAQHAGLVIVTEMRGDGKANLTLGGRVAAPQPIHTHTLPAWGQPHVGTSALGTTVVVYPHCSQIKRLTTCNLWAFDVTFGTDTQLTGSAAASGTGELEGDMDRGALAFTAGPAGRPSRTRSRRAATATSRRRCSTSRTGSRSHAARNGRDPDRPRPRPDRPGARHRRPPGVPRALIEIISTKGSVDTVARQGCRDRGVLLAPTLFRTEIVWGLRTTAASTLRRRAIHGGRTQSAPTSPFAVVAPTDDASAFQLRGDVAPSLGSDPTRLTSTWSFVLSEHLPFS